MVLSFLGLIARKVPKRRLKMADPKIPGGRWIVAWQQSILSPERGWKCTSMPASLHTIPEELYPGFEWEDEGSVCRYRVIAVLDEHSSKLLSILDELEMWVGDSEYPVFAVIGDIVATVIKGFEQVGRPH